MTKVYHIKELKKNIKKKRFLSFPVCKDYTQLKFC